MNRTNKLQAPLLPRMGHATEASLFVGIEGAPEAPRDAAVWRSELPRILALRLAGLALSAAERYQVDLPADVRDDLRNASRREAVKAFRLEAAMPEIVGVLESSGVPTLITKGPGVARAYPSSGQRPFRDMDVLVEPELFPPAARLLANAGFRQPTELLQPRKYFGRLCREALTLQNDERVVVDLHHHIPPWVWGERLTFSDLWAARRKIELERGVIEIPGSTHAMLIGALHVLSDLGRKGYELLIWRDVVALAAQVDPKQLQEEATRLGLDWAVAIVLEQLPEYARPEHLAPLIAHANVSWSEGFRLRRILPPGKLSRHPIARVFRLPPANAVAYLVGYAIPSRYFLRTRYGSASLIQWWKDSVRRLAEAD